MFPPSPPFSSLYTILLSLLFCSLHSLLSSPLLPSPLSILFSYPCSSVLFTFSSPLLSSPPFSSLYTILLSLLFCSLHFLLSSPLLFLPGSILLENYCHLASKSCCRLLRAALSACSSSTSPCFFNNCFVKFCTWAIKSALASCARK